MAVEEQGTFCSKIYFKSQCELSDLVVHTWQRSPDWKQKDGPGHYGWVSWGSHCPSLLGGLCPVISWRHTRKPLRFLLLLLFFGLKANLKTSDHDKEWKFIISVLMQISKTFSPNFYLKKFKLIRIEKNRINIHIPFAHNHQLLWSCHNMILCLFFIMKIIESKL